MNYHISTREGPARDGTPAEALRAFCLEHQEPLLGRLRTRWAQTHEVGRSAALLPALYVAAGAAQRALGLVEVGASAGLNLLSPAARG